MEKLYLGNTIGVRAGVFDSSITKMRSRCCKFSNFVPLLISRGLPMGAKGRLYSACVRSVK